MNSGHKEPQFPEVMTPEQVAEYLQLPVDLVLSYLEQGKMPAVKIGDAWRVRRGMLDQWLDEQSLPTQGNERIRPARPANSEVVRDGSPLEGQQTSKAQHGSVKPHPKRLRGKVKSFNPRTGYGFIRSDDGREIFVHAVDIENYGQDLRSGHRVEFTIRRVPKGWQAYDVVILREKEVEPAISSGVHLIGPPKPRPVISRKSQIAYEQALAAREIGDFKRARELFEEAIRQGPSLNVFQAYAAMEEKDNPQNAARVLEKGISFFPDAGILYNDYAMLKRRLGDLQGAVEILRQGLDAAPAFARQLHWSLARVLIDLGGEEALTEAAEHAKHAEELGERLQGDEKYIKLRVLTGPKIGKETFSFFESLGFDIKPHSFGSQYADLLVRSDLSEYVETYDLREWILVRCFYSSINQYHLNMMQNYLRDPPLRLPGRLKLNQDIAFLVAEDIASLRDALYRLMGDNREAIVPIDLPSLEASHGEDPSKILRTILDQWLSRRDLYRFNYPVSGRRFFGREVDLQRLMRDIDDGHNVGVFGLRKVGKTSLLHQLRELRPQDITVYLDIQGVPSDSQDCAYLYWAIAYRLRDEYELKKDVLSLGDIVFQLGSQKTPRFQKRTFLQFDHDIRAVLDRLEQSDAPTRLVLILDEVDRLLPAPGFSPGFRGYSDFFAYLRGTSQNSQGRFVTIITAANPTLCEQAMWEGRDNPIFQFYHQMFLPPLTREDCNDMVIKLGRGMGISYSSESLEAIFRATSGHPYLTRLLCSQISQISPSRPLYVTPEEVERARYEFLHGEATPIFNEILERLDAFFPTESDLLLFIAGGVDSESELSDLVNQPVDVALYHLMGYQLVERVSGRYRIKIDLLREWLHHYRLGK